jgi:hypothetical protein
MAQATKNRAAVALGRRRMELMTPEDRLAMSSAGGRAGGRARADSMTAKQRKESARKAAVARWAPKKKG